MNRSALNPGRLASWPVVLVFLLSLLTVFTVRYFYEERQRELQMQKASSEAVEYQRMLQAGASAYVRLNSDVAALFTAAGTVNRREFEIYLRSTEALLAHPGLGHVNYIPRVPQARRRAFEAAARKASPGYRIHGGRPDADDFYPCLYDYAADGKRHRLDGLDFSGVPDYWEAMQLARDSGESVATRKHPHQEGTAAKSAFAVFTPVFDTRRLATTPAERRAALTGFVVTRYVVEDVVEGVMGARFKQQFDLEIYDTQPDRQHLFYDGDGRPHALDGSGLLAVHRERVRIAGRDWLLYFYPKPAYFERYRTGSGMAILLFGLCASVALAMLTKLLLRQRLIRRMQAEQSQRFQAIFENHPAAVFALDPHGRFLNANAQALKEFRTTKNELVGTQRERYLLPENRERAKEIFQNILAGQAQAYDTTIVNRDGERVEVSVVMIPITSEGVITSVLGIAQNITDRKQTEWQLQESRQMLQLVINNIPQRVFWKNTELVYLGCNQSFSEDAGLSHPDEVIGRTDYELSWKAEAEAYRADDRETVRSGTAKINYEEPQQREDGRLNWLRTSKIPLRNDKGETVAVLGLYEDITERKELEQKLERMAHYDALTGLANRALFRHLADQALNRSERQGGMAALLYLDIDKFKSINDTHGHDVGDALLREFAVRIKATVRQMDIAARLGGDEFALLLQDLPEPGAAAAVAAKLVEAMATPFRIGDRAFQVSTSVGVAFHESGTALDGWIRAADQAMYRAKQAGRNRYEVAGGPGR